MIKLTWNTNFERALKRYIKKHPDSEEKIREKLRLFTEEPFTPALRNHKLRGRLKDLRAIVVEYDCRIVFKLIDENTAMLVGIGSPDDVY